MFWCPVSVQVRCTMTQYSRCFHIRCSFSVSSRDDLHIQFIVYPRRRRPLFDVFFWPVKYTAWHKFSGHSLSVKDRVFCDSRRHVCSVESHVVGWYAVSTDKDGCRRFERSVTQSFRVKQSKKILRGLLSLHGVTSRKSGVLNSTATPNSCSAKLRCSVVTIVVVVVCYGLADGYHLPGVGLWRLLPFELYWRIRNSVFRHPVLMLQQFHLDVVLAIVRLFRPQKERK